MSSHGTSSNESGPKIDRIGRLFTRNLLSVPIIRFRPGPIEISKFKVTLNPSLQFLLLLW